MTDEQRKLVEDNHALIYHTIHSMGLLVEEVYDIAAIGLCKAAIKYDSRKHKFSTFAVRCIRNEILHDFRQRNMKKRAMNEQLISYNEPVLYQDGETILLIDQIESNISTEDEALSHIMYEEIRVQLGKTDSKVLPYFGKGYTQHEIARMMGVSQANISRVKKRAEKILCCN